MPVRLILFADDKVGEEIYFHLFENYRNDLCQVVTTGKNTIFEHASSNSIPCTIKKELPECEQITSAFNQSGPFDWGILAWWPCIIKEPLLSLPQNGFINTHPSMLPHNRGKNPNFWALIEQCPFGVTLHKINHKIDDGQIIAQREIPYNWEDTGESLYSKALSAMTELFVNTYPNIRSGNIDFTKPDPAKETFHLAKEIDEKSTIDLESIYTAKDFLNLLRARTFRGFPGCRFTDNGQDYEICISISKVE